jgi:hypothetical protein
VAIGATLERAVKVKLGALADNDDENDDDDDEDESDMVPSACASGGIVAECAPAESSARAVFPRDPPSSECSNCVRVDGAAPPLAVATWTTAVPATAAVVAAPKQAPAPVPVAAPTAGLAFRPDPFELGNGDATLACCGATTAADGAASRYTEGTAFFPPPR